MDKAALLQKLQQIKESTKQIIDRGNSNDGETTTDATTDKEQS